LKGQAVTSEDYLKAGAYQDMIVSVRKIGDIVKELLVERDRSMRELNYLRAEDLDR